MSKNGRVIILDYDEGVSDTNVTLPKLHATQKTVLPEESRKGSHACSEL
jgi:hypothetical protein